MYGFNQTITGLMDVDGNTTAGICFGSNYTILHLVTPDNPSKPCLSCTKQWCINQNLPICQGATLGDTDPDTATGKEGDVEARCFRAFAILSQKSYSYLLTCGCYRAGLATRSTGRHTVLAHNLWPAPWSRN